MRVYTVYDKVAAEGGPLFQAKNDGTAMRSFIHLIADNKVDSALDYVLYCIAEWNPENLTLKPLPCPEEVIYDAKEIINE